MSLIDASKYPYLDERFKDLEKAPNNQEWTSTVNQDTFTLTNGSYVVGSKTLEVTVDGIPQPPSLITELTSTSFKLDEKLVAGIKVVARWFEGKVPVVFNHNATHYKDGQDELDIYKLKNGDVLKGQINVKYPPAPLTGLKGDGTEEGTAIQTLLNNISSNYTKATVSFPYGTYKSNTGLVIPDNIDMFGLNLAKLDFSGAPSNVVAIKRSGSKTRFGGFEIVGNGFNDGVKTGKTSIGLDVYGDNHSFENLVISDFASCIDIAHSATYILKFDNMLLKNSDYCLYADLATRSATNAGERIGFHNTTFCNSKLGVIGNLSALDIYFNTCSFDYCNELGSFGNGIYSFVSCHFENTINNSNRGIQSLVDWFISTTGGASLLFTNCLFDLYGIHVVISPGSTLGTAIYKNCRAYFRAGDGTDKNYHSEHPFYMDINKTTASLYSPFVSKINLVSFVTGTMTDKRQVPLHPSVATDLVNYKYDFTFDVATPERTWIRAIH